MNPLTSYLDRLHEIHATQRGTPELSYRAALENLLNAVGAELDPAVQATAELADDGSGRPDFGVFERKSGNPRGAVEVKPPEHDVPQTADGTQVARYWNRYGVVLVTNYRDFLLVARENDSRARVEARYTLAGDAESFWALPRRAAATEHAEALMDFLSGALTRAAPVTRPRDLAADLARHAREAKRRIESHDVAALAPLQQAMEQSLGLHFEGRDGEAFFRSSLVQTLFYGLFSGWMLWRERAGEAGSSSPRKSGTGVSARRPFDWKDASEHLALPLIGELYEEIARPTRLADLGLREPLDWATSSLNRVDEDEFFRNFDADHAITLFYEPFLQAFDPRLRKELGVWYTPPEIVQYMVGRVDQLLRSELGIADGLADEQVYVLDPACGTGSYIVEVARRIHQTLSEHGHGALAAAGVRKALTTRVFGFEILPAPYVVSHLQLGVLLRSLGTSLAPGERVEVYLTNALTGWEPPKAPRQKIMFAALEREAERAQRVKREAPILVILGNPPYNRFAGVAEDEEADLIAPYKAGLYEKWGVRKQLLDDLYIRFYRLAEKRIAEAGGRGIVCFISNYSWLQGVSHPLMRERLVTSFDRIIIDNCNGDKYRTGKRTPDGLPDESMFTTDEHRIGIQVGTAIATLVRTHRVRSPRRAREIAKVDYRDLWGTGNAKRAELVASLRRSKRNAPKYVNVSPRATMRWVLVNGELGEPGVYETWPRLADIFPVHYSGLNENRSSAFLAIDRSALERRLRAYFDPRTTLAELREAMPGAATDVAGFDAADVRRKMLNTYPFDPRRIRPLAYRPFDDWWCYWEERAKLLNRPRPDFVAQLWPGNVFLSASQTARKGDFNQPTIVDKLGDLHLQDPWSQFFPRAVRSTDQLSGQRSDPNLDPKLLEAACAAAGQPPCRAGSRAWTAAAAQIAERVFYHSLAILWSPAYRDENTAALRQDWPRIPIPAEPRTLEASAALGRTVADLLLPDNPVRGVTTGKLCPELRDLAVATRLGGGNIDPANDLTVDAGWGFHGQKKSVMCGKGRVEPSSDHPNAVNVFMNARVYWANVPNDVWSLTIGGYPVIKKWLSYREQRVLGRPLTLEELTYLTQVVRRLKALLLLGPDLDANYRACAANTLRLSD